MFLDQATTTAPPICAPGDRITRSLLGYGVLAGPFYVAVSLTQVLVRDGFDLRRHEWSLLANGPGGWVHIVNLVLTGAMVIAAACGLDRALSSGPGRRAVPVLIGSYGAALVGAGVFVADPMLGFPVGTADGPPTQISWHGVLHLVSGGVGFGCLIAACLVVGRRFARAGQRGWAWFSRITGVAFLVGFAGVVSAATTPAVNMFFTGAVLLAWGWLSSMCAYVYRTAGHQGA